MQKLAFIELIKEKKFLYIEQTQSVVMNYTIHKEIQIKGAKLAK